MIGFTQKQVIYRKINLASVARHIYLTKSKTLGVGTLKRMYGKKKRRGVQAPIFMKHSGKILRSIVKQLKDIGYLENRVFILEEDNKKRLLGLTLTKTGHAELDKVASKILRPTK